MTQKDLFPKIPSKPKKGKKDVTIREWRVQSFTSNKKYTVTQKDSKWFCDCPYFTEKKRQCKHITLKKQELGLVKPDMSGFKSAIQKAIRRGNLPLLKLSFQQLWEKDKRWLLWRLPILAGEEVESYVGLTGRLQGNATREAVWELLVRMTLSPKSKEGEGLRVASHIVTEERWRPEDWVQGEGLFQLKSWMDRQTRFQATGKDKRPFWEWFEKHFQASQGYSRETLVTCKKRSGMGGMVGDVELMTTVAFLASTTEWTEPPMVEVPQEQDIEPVQSLPWWCHDQHSRIGKIVSWKLREMIQDKQEWRYIVDDLWFNQESAKVNALAPNSFWWPAMLRMLWKKYGKTEQEAKEDWQVWRPRIKALVEKEMANQHV